MKIAYRFALDAPERESASPLPWMLLTGTFMVTAAARKPQASFPGRSPHLTV